MKRHLAWKLALAAGALVVSLAAAEVVVRAAKLAPGFGGVALGQHVLSADAALGWENNPAAAGVRALGLRGPEPEPAGDRVRILVIGDSVAYGVGLGDDETIPRRIERALESAGARAQVLNGGVAAYDTKQEARWLASRFPALRPDHVVVIYCLNDHRPGDSFNEGLMREASKHGKLRDWALAQEAATFSPFARAVLARSHLARVVYQVATASRAEDASHRGKRAASDVDYRPTREGFESIARTCAAAGVGVTVAIVPLLGSFEPYRCEAEHKRVKSMAEAYGFGAIDLLAPFANRARSSGHSLALPDDTVHPNAEGADVAGGAVAAALLRAVPRLRSGVAGETPR